MSIDQPRPGKMHGYMLLLRFMIFSHEIYTKDSYLEYVTAYTDNYKDLHIYLLSADIGQPGEYNTGDNVHDGSEGKQKTGNVRIGNRANESGDPIKVSNSKNINTGRNKSGGKDGQETGDIDIGNVG